MTFVIEGVKIISLLPNFTTKEARRYLDFAKSKTNTPLVEVKIEPASDGKVDVSFFAKGEPFERIRRITGYLVGTTDRWNDAKQSEERERVKHDWRD